MRRTSMKLVGEDNLTEYDFAVQDEGKLFVLHPCNDAARSWIEDNLYDEDGTGPNWWGGGVIVEDRFIVSVVEGIIDSGLTVH